MLPDKNELNDELIEQVNGGYGKEFIKTDITITEDIKLGACIFTCPNCGNHYEAKIERTDGFCPNCESQAIQKNSSSWWHKNYSSRPFK